MRARNALLGLAYGTARTLRGLGLYETGLYRGLRALARRALFRRGSDFPLPYAEIRVGDLELVAPSTSAWVYGFADVEPGTRAFVERTLGPGMTFVDVGAHVGVISLTAARLVGDSGRVFAVEPAPDNLVFLRHNVERNRAGNLTVLPVAAGADRRSAQLILRASGDRHGLVADDSEPTLGAAEVEVRPLDDLVSGPVDLVKIDAEGSDLEVLAGMRRLLSDSPSLQIVVEWNRLTLGNAGYDFDELPRRLETMGLECQLMHEASGELLPVEETLTAEREGRLGAGWFANLVARRP